MKNHDELIKSVFERGEAAIAEQKRRSAVIRRTVISVSGLCAAAVIGYGVWSSDALRNAVSPDPDSQFPISEPTTAVTTAETTSAPVSTTAAETKNTTATAATTVTAPDTTATSATSSATTSVSAERTTSSETTTTSSATTTRITTTTTNTTAATATTTQDWSAGGNEGGGGWGGWHSTTTTTVTTTGTTPSIVMPTCYCTVKDLNGQSYYSCEEEVSPDDIGEYLTSVYIDIYYAGGYKGYTKYKTQIKGSVYDYSDDAIAIRYDGGEEYYLFYKSKEV